MDRQEEAVIGRTVDDGGASRHNRRAPDTTPMMNEKVRERLRHLERLEGYVMPQSTPSEGQPTSPANILKLDANENVFLNRDWLIALAMDVVQELDPRFYSTHEYQQLVHALSVYHDIAPEHIVLGNGGDQIIDFVAKTFLDAGAKAVCIQPTYSFYRLRAKLAGARWINVPLNDDFSLNVNRLLEAAQDANVIFLCSPNNPTGNQFVTAQIKEVLQSFAGIVFVDEAYADFADENLVQWVAEFEHLVILRTFSKAFGLAGLRLGYMLAHPTLARPFAEKVQYPYPVSAFTLAMALKLMQQIDVVQAAIEQMKRERARLIQELASVRGVRPFVSASNFVLLQLALPAEKVHYQLMDEGIFLKNVGTVLGMTNCLRTTVGTPPMNDRLLQTLRRICQS